MNKQLMISVYTKKLISRKGLILEDSNNTNIRFSCKELDKIVGFVGEGWTNKIKRMLLFEVDNRANSYIVRLFIGPGNTQIRKDLYELAKSKPEIYNRTKSELTQIWKTIYSIKFLNQEELNTLSYEEICNSLESRFDRFISDEIPRLCEGLILDQREVIEDIPNVIDGHIIMESLKDTERTTIVKARIGHGELKKKLVQQEECCKICGLSDERFLIASHIKPWSQSDPEERLDLNNVLLLCPHHDAAFDKGFITFDEDGTLLISSTLIAQTKILLNLVDDKNYLLTKEQQRYVTWHRDNIFKGIEEE